MFNDVRNKTNSSGILSRTPSSGVLVKRQSKFDPSKITGLVGWWKFDTGCLTSGVSSADGESVDAVDNLVVGGANLVTDGVAPVFKANDSNFGTKGSLLFDGASTSLKCDSMSTYFTGDDKPLTIAIIIDKIEQAATQTFWSLSHVDGTSYNRFYLYDSQTNYKHERKFDATTAVTVAHQAVTASPAVIISAFSGTSMNFYLNGAVDTDAQDTGAPTFSKFTIGCRKVTSDTTRALWYKGYMLEMCIYNKQLDSGEVANLNSYLTKRLT